MIKPITEHVRFQFTDPYGERIPGDWDGFPFDLIAKSDELCQVLVPSYDERIREGYLSHIGSMLSVAFLATAGYLDHLPNLGFFETMEEVATFMDTADQDMFPATLVQILNADDEIVFQRNVYACAVEVEQPGNKHFLMPARPNSTELFPGMQDRLREYADRLTNGEIDEQDLVRLIVESGDAEKLQKSAEQSEPLNFSVPNWKVLAARWDKLPEGEMDIMKSVSVSMVETLTEVIHEQSR